jgi:hypothetical protein
MAMANKHPARDLPACCIRSASAPAFQPINRLERASSAVQTLLGWFDENTGLYKTTGWWNSANITTVLADYSRISKSKQYFVTLADTFVAAQNAHPAFLNKYYDDEGWWVLAWVDAYDLTGNKVYLSWLNPSSPTWPLPGTVPAAEGSGGAKIVLTRTRSLMNCFFQPPRILQTAIRRAGLDIWIGRIGSGRGSPNRE